MAPAVLAAAEAALPGDLGLRPRPVPRAGLRRAGRGPGPGGKGLCRGRARAAARAVACGAHRDRGYADGADWLAQTTGQSRAEARSELGTAGSLADLPATADALAHGEVSLKEAAEVARGEAERPGSEDELVALAKAQGLGAVKEEVRKTGPTGPAPPRTWPSASTPPVTSATGATSWAWCASAVPCPPRWA